MFRPLLSCLAMASMFGVMNVQARQESDFDLLVGTYTQGASQGFYRLGFDSQTGLIDSQPRQVVQAGNPSWLALSREGGYLFVANENGPGQADERGKVSSYTVDGSSHQVTAINQVASQGDEPTHANLTLDQRFLLVANYAVQPRPGGSLAVFPVDSSGRLGDAVQVLGPNPPSKVNAERQASSHVHAVVPAPEGDYVVAADLGADRLFVYRYDPSLAQPLRRAAHPQVRLPPGSGPRHLLFSEDGRHAWLTLEMSAQVAVFDYQNGQFRQTQLVDLKGSDKRQAVGASGLHASADGRFLYVANRGDANQLLVFGIDPASGHLKEIQRRSVEGREPREFSIDPSGRFLLVANQKSNQIVTLRRDPQTGMLGDIVQALDIDSPSALVFLPAAR
ncbi:lactonase family protein [Pseudomonas sp. DTU_2021_1001937_2_SI_NGA_ILE_001]|uniref:lactonase family protein n=1 Tax=Pseudomonas sp. DTU_2021_1001937_2_SI_NGA_ILE_001 TaxID=3077589 RepID=UPI0025DB833F|nr:lactonase family protein [Pseudomonas sp. DTU_2021_1001937_2_SI_NGA_ILE_001]WNW14155.1 lactonase family protein [Pseudomonas sp. DTU_2021_1001937_2_SI_NGA_ILE_001]